MQYKSPLSSLIITIFCQMSGFIFGNLFLFLNLKYDLHIIVHILSAFFIARYLKLSLPWQILNLVLPMGIIFCLHNQIPNVFWIIFLIIFLIYSPTYFTKVPFYPSNEEVYEAVLNELPNDKITFLDAGCGTASLLFYLAKRKKESSFSGIEINPLIFLYAKIRSIRYKNVKIRYQDLWKIDLSKYSILYTFLAPPFMPRVYKKAKNEMKKGSIFISNSFPAPIKATKEIELSDRKQSRVYVYKF